MKKISRLCSAFLLASSLFPQPVNPLTIDPPQKVTVQRGKSTTLKVQARIATGYHVNSNTPHEDYLIPLRLTLAASPLVVEAIKYPAPHDEKYSFSEKPLSVLTGDFAILVTVKAPENLEPQMHVFTGKLRYQACSDKACLTPKTVEFRLAADVR
jgi:thiol:disulfide interchange protein DsbD